MILFQRTCILAFLGLLGLATSSTAMIRAENVATGFIRPVFVTAPTGDTQRLFVVEKRGLVKIIVSGSVLARPYLDIRSLVNSADTEQGLLGLAFDPDYGSNGYLYVYYTRTGGGPAGSSQIARFTVSTDPDSVDPSTRHDIFSVGQPFTNHNGGHIEFGSDDLLYWASGDGGGANDPLNSGQNGLSLLGKVLRLDVRGDDFPLDPTRNYAIPANNPFVGNPNVLDEIWALGLRNPYRFCFDSGSGDLYIADVGQNCWEEIDYQPASSGGGENYGWRIREGSHCFDPQDEYNCNIPGPCGAGLTDPIHEYSHTTDVFSCSITGGRVYRGSVLPALSGHYFYADYCSNQVYSLRYDGATVHDLTNRTAELNPPIGGGTIDQITAIGEDGVGELYIVKETTFGAGGTIFKIVPDPSILDAPQVDRPVSFRLSGGAPNPFTTTTRFRVRLDRRSPLAVSVYSATGGLVRHLHRGVTAPGVVPVEWDGRDARDRPVPAGVYFIRAESAGRVDTERIVRIR
jgi:glucose/arabinose dehydrogenase